MAIAISPEQPLQPPVSQRIVDNFYQFGERISTSPLIQHVRGVMRRVRSFSGDFQASQEALQQHSALQDTRELLALINDGCMIKVDKVRPDGNAVKLGIYDTSGTLLKLANIHVALPTLTQGPEINIWPSFTMAASDQPNSLFTLSQEKPGGKVSVIHKGKLVSPQRGESTYELAATNILTTQNKTQQQDYASTLYPVLAKLRQLGNQGMSAYAHGSVHRAALTYIANLASGALKDTIRDSGVHAAIRANSTEWPLQPQQLTTSQKHTIQKLSQNGLSGTYELRDHPNPQILGAAMVKYEGSAHYIIATAEKTYFGTAENGYLPRFSNGKMELVDPQGEDETAVSTFADSDIHDTKFASMLRKIGDALRQEATDKKAMRNADTSLGRVRTTPPPIRAIREPFQYTEPPQAAAYLFAPPVEKVHLAYPRIQFDSAAVLDPDVSERQTSLLPTSDFSLPSVPRQQEDCAVPMGQFSIPRPFTLAEVNEYLARAPEEPSLPDIPAIMPKSQRNFVSSHTLVDARSFKQGMRARARTIGEAYQLSPIQHEPTQPLTTAQVLARHSQVRRPLEEHRRPPRSSTHQLA